MEVRDRIIEEATKQFFQYGIRNVTMDDIAICLGMSKRTVYEIFKDKGELVETCINKLTKKEDKKVVEVISGSSNVIEAIFVFMRDGIKAMKAINPVFFKDLEKLYSQLWKRLEQESKKKRYNLISKLLIKGVNEGLFRNDLNIEIVSILFYQQMNLLSDETVFPKDKYDHPEVFQNMVFNFARGISTSKGIRVIDEIMK